MNPIIKKNGLTFGIILAVIGVLTTTITYVTQLFTAWWITLIVFVVSIAVYCIMLSRTKKELGGITFKEAFTTYFIAASIAVLVGTLFNITLYNFVDPGAQEIVKEQSIKATVSFMKNMGTPTSQINDAVERLENDNPLSIGKQLFGGVVGLAVSCVIGLILAAIFKNRQTYQD
ncbi:DUF4199 domain-containing protein [Flavobacterium sp.]|uniref:DUF4199 domain-containing protein n=1 Tax=Flavobacterium sp. TaxID=239 RepID=UPI0012072ADB|nr:DUF4199 domain-containing protein [Flavobacterium sp.]RZJ73665.1 MAG: DUF4199 domain-containing protein [Flavobacterium sp.]